MVPERGLEPPRLAPQPPQDCVSTSSTTPACAQVYLLSQAVIPLGSSLRSKNTLAIDKRIPFTKVLWLSYDEACDRRKHCL